MQLDEIIAQTCDCHIHFGQFRDEYFSVSQLVSQIQSIGIARACVMPTGFYSKKEFFENYTKICPNNPIGFYYLGLTYKDENNLVQSR